MSKVYVIETYGIEFLYLSKEEVIEGGAKLGYKDIEKITEYELPQKEYDEAKEVYINSYELLQKATKNTDLTKELKKEIKETPTSRALAESEKEFIIYYMMPEDDGYTLHDEKEGEEYLDLFATPEEVEVAIKYTLKESDFNIIQRIREERIEADHDLENLLDDMSIKREDIESEVKLKVQKKLDNRLRKQIDFLESDKHNFAVFAEVREDLNQDWLSDHTLNFVIVKLDKKTNNQIGEPVEKTISYDLGYSTDFFNELKQYFADELEFDIEKVKRCEELPKLAKLYERFTEADGANLTDEKLIKKVVR